VQLAGPSTPPPAHWSTTVGLPSSVSSDAKPLPPSFRCCGAFLTLVRTCRTILEAPLTVVLPPLTGPLPFTGEPPTSALPSFSDVWWPESCCPARGEDGITVFSPASHRWPHHVATTCVHSCVGARYRAELVVQRCCALVPTRLHTDRSGPGRVPLCDRAVI
jgi:hypothetical protein